MPEKRFILVIAYASVDEPKKLLTLDDAFKYVYDINKDLADFISHILELQRKGIAFHFFETKSVINYGGS